jgi:checkpoint serine/threonine-protein kinase
MQFQCSEPGLKLRCEVISRGLLPGQHSIGCSCLSRPPDNPNLSTIINTQTATFDAIDLDSQPRSIVHVEHLNSTSTFAKNPVYDTGRSAGRGPPTMSASEDLINFDVIETQKENIQSLPGGRSAKALAQIFSSGSNGDKYASPSPNETRTLNDAIRQEYEAEIQASTDSDDPLDVYDRYVKWTMNAYPSAQATAESGLLSLLERATKAFLNSTHYKNDPRYLRLWLQYVRLFSDAPRETFAFLSRHNVGQGLALFYEEFAAWLEGAGRWAQAEEVYKLGLEREARPQERLLRKFGEFRTRFEQQPRGSDGPSSPALPTVRAALAAKVDPFSTARTTPADPQEPQSRGVGGSTTKKSGKPKMAIFADSDEASSQPAVSGQPAGWDSIQSIRDRRKENTVEAKPWAGETMKSEKQRAPVQKMAIFRDEVSTEQDSSF